MSATQVIASSSKALDFSKYARPELVTAVSRVADFFGDAVQNVALPPLCLILITVGLSYFLPFSSTLATILFLVIGITGSILTGVTYPITHLTFFSFISLSYDLHFFLFPLSIIRYGAHKFITMAARDLKFIVTETLYLVHNIISDVSSYIHNPAAFPPLSDIVHGVLGTVIKPVILGVFEKKFYGSILKYIADPMLSGVDKWLTAVVGSMERRFVHPSPTKGKAITSSGDHQHDKKSYHASLATENQYLIFLYQISNKQSLTPIRDGAVIVKRERLYEALENVRKRTVPKIDEYARKFNRPLRVATFAFGGATLLLTSLVYSM